MLTRHLAINLHWFTVESAKPDDAYRWIILGKEGKAGNDPCNFHTKHLEITTGQKFTRAHRLPFSLGGSLVSLHDSCQEFVCVEFPHVG